MRNSITATLSGLLFLAGLGLISLSGHDHKAPALPDQITEFYHDYNYICSFSTQAERKELVKYLGSGYLPAESKSGRLKEIFELMKKVKQRIFFDDAYVTAPGKVFLWTNVFRPEYYKITSFNSWGSRAAVGVSAYEIQLQDVLRYVSRYSDVKSGEENAPTLDQLLSEMGKIICRKESHEWILHAGQWKKKDGQFVYIKR